MNSVRSQIQTTAGSEKKFWNIAILHNPSNSSQFSVVDSHPRMIGLKNKRKYPAEVASEQNSVQLKSSIIRNVCLVTILQSKHTSYRGKSWKRFLHVISTRYAKYFHKERIIKLRFLFMLKAPVGIYRIWQRMILGYEIGKLMCI